MPQLSDLIEKRKFVKKEYRPWDLSGTGTVDGKEAANQEPAPEPTPAPAPAPEINPVPEVQAAPQPKLEPQPEPIVVKPAVSSPESYPQLGNKTGNELDNNQVTKRQQPGNIKVTKKPHLGNKKVTTREHKGNELDNELGNELGNKKSVPYFVAAIKKLTGLQKNIFFYVTNLCSARGVLDTGNILTTDLAIAANCSGGSAKTSLIRLIEKNLVLRLEGKRSRGGHMVLGINREIQAAAIQVQQTFFNPCKLIETGNELGNETGNELGNNAYSSSSINKNNTTTTVLPENWKKINFEQLSDIGFSETQLRQLFDSNMSDPEIVQDAINRFAFSLQHNEKVKAYASPLNVLMGVLRKGQRWNEPNYVPPKQLALQQLLEEKRQQKEKYESMLQELIDLEFPAWVKKLTEEEIKAIVPATVLRMNVSAATQSSLRSYFREKIIAPRFSED